MFGRASTMPSPVKHAGVNALLGFVMGIGIAMLSILSSGTAQACPNGGQHYSESTEHNAKRAVAAVVLQSVMVLPSFGCTNAEHQNACDVVVGTSRIAAQERVTIARANNMENCR